MKKIIYLLLSVILILSLVACGNQQNDDVAGSTDIANDTEIVYVPEFVELEGAESIGWSNMRFVGDDLYYISYNWDTDLKTLISISLNRYSISENTTAEMELPLPEDASIDMWTVGEDGSFYAILSFLEWNEVTQSPKYTYRLEKYDAKGEELFVSDITELLNTEGFRKRIEVDGEGRTYISDNISMWLFDANGGQAGRVGSGSGMGGQVNSFCRGTDGRIYVAVTQNDGNGSVTNLWAVNFEKKELEDICSDFLIADVFCQNTGDNFVLYDNSAVYVYDMKSQEAEKLFAWLDCDMNGMNVKGFGVLADGRIAAAFQDLQSYDSGLVVINGISADQVIPKQEIVLGMMSQDLDIEAAVTKFNKRNQYYRVTIRYYIDQGSGTDNAVSDALTRLNVDIVSDNCPDILNLDGINVQQLADKDVFEDLTPYLEQSSMDRSDLLENALEAYTFDNKLICIPDSFIIRTTIGSTALVGERMGWTLDEMIAFADAHPDADLFDRRSKEKILEYCLNYSMDSFVDWAKGSCYFDTDEFKGLLQFADRFPDADSVSVDEDQLTTPERIHNGEVLLADTQIYDMDAIQLYVAMFNGPVTCIGYPSTDGRNVSILLPYGTYAITSVSNVKEGAWAFLESYLTRENPLYRLGFPNCRSELERIAAGAVYVEYILDENGEPILDEWGNPMVESQSTHGTGYGDWIYEYHVSTQEEVDMVLQLIEVARLQNESNEPLMIIINEEAVAFFQGQKSVDEVAETIQRRANVYVSENS